MKKVHITEEQLNYIKKRLTETYTVDVTDRLEAGKSPSQVVSDMTAKNPSLSNDASSGEVNFAFNPKGIDEDVEESRADLVDRDSEEYYEVRNFISDLEGTPQYYQLLNSLDGFTGDVNAAVDDIRSQLGRNINRMVVYAALKDFQRETKRRMEGGDDRYSYAMEGKTFTKRQIKEAKIKKLQENSVVFRKKDLR